MFNKKTVFIIGAGASAEYGFPVGTMLRDRIVQLLKVNETDPWIDGPGSNFLRHIARDQKNATAQDYYEASRPLYHVLPSWDSIDDFLHNRQSQHRLVEVGKLAIAKLILQSERASALTGFNRHKGITGTNLVDTWLFRLIKMLAKGRTLEQVDLLFENVSFISFNYDRSLEQFLSVVIAELFEVELDRAKRVVAETVFIHHAYGSLGPLPGFASKGRAIDYGAGIADSELAPIADSIRTYTEAKDEKADETRVRDEIAKARKLVFLGFGFHPLNMSLLQPSAPVINECEIIATAKDMEEPNIKAASNRVVGFFGSTSPPLRQRLATAFENVSCAELLRRHSMALPQ